MRLDDVFEALGGTDEGLATVQGVRELLDAFAALLNDDLPQVGAFHPGVPFRRADGRDLTLDVIVPPGAGPLPVLVYLHGGAWVWGSPATHRKLTFRLAERGFLVLSVDYRLAPEHPFPCGLNDCIHAIHFAAHNAERWGGSPERLAVAGDSAGANLAAAAAIELASSAGAPAVRAVGLLYGVYDFTGFESDGVTRLLTDAYLGEDAPRRVADPRVSPVLKAAALPPAHVAVGAADPLIEDAETLRAALAGNVHDYHVYDDMPHAFMQMEFLPPALDAIDRLAGFLHETLTGEAAAARER